MTSLPVNALLRGLLVLEAVSAYGPAGLSEIRKHTGIPKATTLRLLESLRQAGYLVFDPQARTYSVSLRTLSLSNNVFSENHLLQVARPVMHRLRQKLGWPSDLAVFQHDKMVIMDTNRQPGMLSSNRTIGSRVPIMASATGRAYLAGISHPERQLIVEVLRSSTDPFERLARDSAAVERLVDSTVRRGYALSDQEFLPTNRGAAVAILKGETVACVINLIAIASLASIQEVEHRYVPLLLEAKAELEEQLGVVMPSAADMPRQVMQAGGRTRSTVP